MHCLAALWVLGQHASCGCAQLCAVSSRATQTSLLLGLQFKQRPDKIWEHIAGQSCSPERTALGAGASTLSEAASLSDLQQLVSDVLQVVTHRESQLSLAVGQPDSEAADADVSGTYAAMLILKALATYVRGVHKVRTHALRHAARSCVAMWMLVERLDYFKC